MIEVFKLALSGFWAFWGVLIILALLCNFILQIIHKIIRAITISKHGYPPPHCDGDGDFKETEK